MQIFHYHPATGAFLGEGRADPSPLEPDVWLVPAYATATAPLDAGDGEQVLWVNGAWQVLPVPEPEPEQEPKPEPAPPREIHVAWFKVALADMGHLDAVDAVVETLPAAKRIMWEYATSIIETDDDVMRIASSLRIDLAAVFDRAEAIRSGKFG